jgi:hypothetical protein
MKIKQLQMKLMHTAAIEIALLNAFNRRVNSVMRIALASGASRINQGKSGFMSVNDECRMTKDK